MYYSQMRVSSLQQSLESGLWGIYEHEYVETVVLTEGKTLSTYHRILSFTYRQHQGFPISQMQLIH